MRSAMGECVIICCAQRTHSSSSSASGTTRFTMPICSASRAEYCRHMNHISRAFFCPTMRARYDEPKPASNDPTLGPVCPKMAFSDAMVRSHTRWSTCPPPMA